MHPETSETLEISWWTLIPSWLKSGPASNFEGARRDPASNLGGRLHFTLVVLPVWGEGESEAPGRGGSMEKDKRATTKLQNGLVFFFYSLKEGLNFKRSPGGKNLKKCEKVWKSAKKSVKKCRNDFALQLLPFSFFFFFSLILVKMEEGGAFLLGWAKTCDSFPTAHARVATHTLPSGPKSLHALLNQ